MENLKTDLRTEWNLGLLYQSDNDPAIEQDLVAIERAAALFERQYKKSDFTKSAPKLLKALRGYEKLIEITNGKPFWYFSLKRDLNSSDTKVAAAATRAQARLIKSGNKLTFFVLTLGKIPKPNQRRYLSDALLAPFRYFLTRTFVEARYHLSEAEEQLENLLAETSYTRWIDGGQKLLNEQKVKHYGKDLPLSEAVSKVSELAKLERRELHGKISQALKSISHFAEAEMNAIVNYKKVMDEKRGYKNSFSATVLNYENEEAEVLALTAAVTKNFKLSHRFYKLQARLLGERQITLADRSVKIGRINKKFDWPTSVAIFRDVLNQLDHRYVTLFDQFLANGQIDVYPKLGKIGGAYCSGNALLPTFILLNHTNDLRSFETLAHEFGHALHTEFSKKQPPLYREYSMAAAEVASTFFEQMALEELARRLSDNDKIILEHNRLLGDVSSIFRQVACFNFEVAMHEMIRREGQVSAAALARLMNEHFQSYLGEAVALAPDDGYFFIYWSHIRHFFYVYSYAYGQLTSRGLMEKWRADHGYIEKINQFLSAGGSMSPKNIFKSIGLNLADPTFFELGLKSLEKDIEKLEQTIGGRT